MGFWFKVLDSRKYLHFCTGCKFKEGEAGRHIFAPLRVFIFASLSEYRVSNGAGVSQEVHLRNIILIKRFSISRARKPRWAKLLSKL